jgi:hypothetical protein
MFFIESIIMAELPLKKQDSSLFLRDTPLKTAREFASKIPVRGGGTGRERSPRSDRQRRPGATRRGGAGKEFKKALFQDMS